jgi:PEGA domain
MAFGAAPARADAQADADALITKGVELREKGKDDQALAVFRQALARSPSARARAQVGLAEQALGMWVLAETDLAAALAVDGDAWIAKNRTALEGALAVVRKHIATLEVRGAEMAEVYIDGVHLGTGPGPFHVEAGRRTLEVRAPGYQSTARAVELPSGGIARETVTLVAVAADPPSPHAPVGAVTAEAPRTVEDPGAGQRLLGWAFVGTGAALLATGAVGLVVRKGIIDDYNATCPGLGVEQPASCDDQVSSSRTWLTVSILTLVGGGVFAAGGAVLVAAAPSANSSKVRSTAGRPRLACGPAGMAIACAGSF